jgi:hypothetical protein
LPVKFGTVMGALLTHIAGTADGGGSVVSVGVASFWEE